MSDLEFLGPRKLTGTDKNASHAGRVCSVYLVCSVCSGFVGAHLICARKTGNPKLTNFAE